MAEKANGNKPTPAKKTATANKASKKTQAQGKVADQKSSAKKTAAGNRAQTSKLAQSQAAEKNPEIKIQGAPGNKAGSQGRAQRQGEIKIEGAQATLGQTFGEMVWLMTQSPLHKQLKLGDLEWLIMPPLMMGQARIFRSGTQAVGMALWAYLTPDEATELGKKGRLDAAGWRHGFNVMDVVTAEKTGKKVDLTPPEVVEGELELWLVDFVCPFATNENKLAQVCLADLMQGPLKGNKLKMHKIVPKTGEKTVIEIGG